MAIQRFTAPDLTGLFRKIDRDRRRVKAEGYTRQGARELLRRYLPTDLFQAAIDSGVSPSVTWAVIRHLCRIKRSMSGLIGRPATEVLRELITGEIHLLAAQRRVLRTFDIAAE